jgi:hypothetical protein
MRLIAVLLFIIIALLCTPIKKRVIIAQLCLGAIGFYYVVFPVVPVGLAMLWKWWLTVMAGFCLWVQWVLIYYCILRDPDRRRNIIGYIGSFLTVVSGLVGVLAFMAACAVSYYSDSARAYANNYASDAVLLFFAAVVLFIVGATLSNPPAKDECAEKDKLEAATN